MKIITKGFIAGLRPKKKRYDLYDDCLHTWVTPTGRVGFAFQTHRGGQGVRVPIATFPNNKLDDHQRGDVQRKYQELYISMEVGSNSTDTVGDLFQACLTEHCPTLRSGKAYQGVLNNTFKEIHGVRLRDLKKRHLLDMHKSLSDRQRLQMSAMRVLRGVLNWGVQHKWLDASPWQDMPKYKSRKRQRVLKDSEIEALWPHLNPILRFILLSGQRVGEVIAMRWVDLEIGAVPVREHNEPTRYPEIKWVQPDNKTGVAHALPLPPLVVSQLPHGFDGIDPVFNGKGVVFQGKTTGRGFSSTRAVLYMLNDALGRAEIEHCAVHDFRRTALTNIARLMQSGEVAERVANHALGDVASRYNLYSFEDVKGEALAKWSQYILGSTEGT